MRVLSGNTFLASGVQGLFTLDASSGEIKTRKLLTGKGRQRPYRMLIRALDRGQASLSSDVPLDIYISDVASNDGVPIFLRPMPNETAFVAEVRFLFILEIDLFYITIQIFATFLSSNQLSRQ